MGADEWPAALILEQRIKYDKTKRHLWTLYDEIMKFRVTENTFFLGKDRKPGDILDNPTGPYKYQPGTGKRTAQFVELPSDDKPQMAAPVTATPLPPAPQISPSAPKPAPVAAPGSFAASLKAMLDEAQAGIEQARTEGRARVGAAVSKLNGVKATTTKVAAGMAQQIEDAADAALSDLGQISNDLG